MGSISRHGVASTLRARLDHQLNLGMDQAWASGPDALGSPTCSPSNEDIFDERAEQLSSLKIELAESYSAIAGESYLCHTTPNSWADWLTRTIADFSDNGILLVAKTPRTLPQEMPF